MDRILTGQGMKIVDNYTIGEVGIPSMVLMERAALSMTEYIKNVISRDKRVLCICGTGNNGADAIAVARQLVCAGYMADILIVGNEDRGSEEFLTQKSIAAKCNVEFLDNVTTRESAAYNEVCKKIQKEYDFIVDGIFGIGLSREIEGVVKDLILYINSITAKTNKNGNVLKVAAVDIPSGLNSSTGQIMGCAIKADYTITFGARKAGMYLCNGKDVCGQIVVRDIGFPDFAYESALTNLQSYLVIEDEDLREYFLRKAHSNKGTYGKVLVIAGSENMYGAAYLSSMAAFKVGAGLVKIVTHKDNRELIYSKLPEAMISTYEVEKDIDNLSLETDILWADAVLIGPGLSTSITAKRLLEKTLNICRQYNKYLVIDADGLNIMSADDILLNMLYDRVVITPHMGEASRLMKTDIPALSNNMVGMAYDFSDKHNVNIILKDSTTVILGIESLENKCNNRVYVNINGNPGMATAGSGDVLAGIVAGILAGGLTKELVEENMTKAMAMSVYIHSVAGDMAAVKLGQVSMMATDIIEMISKVLSI